MYIMRKRRFVKFRYQIIYCGQMIQICSLNCEFNKQFIEFILLNQYRLTDTMKQNRKKCIQGWQDPLQNIQQLYDPFSRAVSNFGLVSKIISKNYIQPKCATILFQDENADDYDTGQCQEKKVELNDIKNIQHVNTRNKRLLTRGKEPEQPNKQKDALINKIIAKKNNPKPIPKPSNQNNTNVDYGFNQNFRVAYPQTPGFKNLLHSPFGKFNSLFKEIIVTLSKEKEIDNKPITEPVELSENPLNFYNNNKLSFDSAKYFVGISLKLRELNLAIQSIFFCCLACYAEPFSSHAWKKYVSQVEQQGKLSKAFILAKTGFLFTQNEQLAKSLISLGERCGMDLHKIQGIMCSISNPEAYQKTLLPESCKLEIKFGKTWKGVKLLWDICRQNDYRLSVCINCLFLARYLENIGFRQKGMNLLKSSFSKSMSKLQIYLQYLQMSIRLNNCLVEADLQEVLKYLDCISGQNRYKLLLEIAEMLYNKNDQRFYTFILNSYRTAVDFCAPGAGCNKSLKQIYYKIAQLKRINPKIKDTLSDNLVFQINRRRFVDGQILMQHEFEDWKYYLHFGAVQRFDLLAQAARKWPLTGRIIAEWIHSLRVSRDPLQMLKIWRDKIDQVPKSGQLWCQGGRIYVQLGQYNNAEKCFRCAMHFTPQYGDSFIEELRLLLRESRLLEVQKLRRLFLVSQPFYGHVLSYLKINHWKQHSLCLNEVWLNAVYEISQDLYKTNPLSMKRQLTAYSPYNYAYTYRSTARERQILFCSYQQMQNKN